MDIGWYVVGRLWWEVVALKPNIEFSLTEASVVNAPLLFRKEGALTLYPEEYLNQIILAPLKLTYDD